VKPNNINPPRGQELLSAFHSLSDLGRGKWIEVNFHAELHRPGMSVLAGRRNAEVQQNDGYKDQNPS
jgi:hypothetical protein